MAEENDEHLDVETRCVRKEATDLTGCCSGIERQEMARQSRAEEGKDCWRKRPGCFLRTCGESWNEDFWQIKLFNVPLIMLTITCPSMAKKQSIRSAWSERVAAA